MSLLIRYGLGCLLLLLINSVSAQVDIPRLSQRVTDLTATLSAAQTEALEQKLTAFEARKGSQIAVLILPSTQPESIEEYGIRLAETWKIGRKNVDDGVILIVAKDDRKLRLEVGYGLEGVIPDAIAKRIIAEIMTPYFKTGDFAGGIYAGVDQLIKLIDGEPLPAPAELPESQLNESAFMFVFIGGLAIGFVLSLVFGRVAGGLIAGVGSGLVAMLFFGLGFMAILIALFVFFTVGFQHNRSGWSSGGGGFGGSGGSGGGFSGGGGGFGGGGASGSW